MANIVKLFALGGLDEDGKNLYVLEINDDIFVFESGMKFPDVKNTGIDMVIPDATYLFQNKDRIRAYFISHGHDDIMGSLPYIYKEAPAPIYCTVNTSYMINLTTRRLNISNNYDYRYVKSGDVVDICHHEVIFFATTHSARDSLGIAVETGDGLVIYTGDFLFDYEALPQYRTDFNLLGRLGDRKVLCLMTESISCRKEGHASPKHKMFPVLEPLFSSNPEGRIFVSIYYQNVFGIREALDLAIKYNRKIFIYGDEMRVMLRDTFDPNLQNMLAKHSITEFELSKIGNENVMILVGGQGEQVFNELSKMASGENRLLTIKSKDTVVIASPEVPGIESFVSKVIDEIYKTGAKIYNTKKMGVISMHAHVEDIKMMLSILKPKYYFPVKGQYQNLLANAKIALNMNLGYDYGNIFMVDNGLICRFEDGVFMGVDAQLDLHEVMIDGLIASDSAGGVIKEREKLGDQGVVVLGVCVDSKEKVIVGGPDIQMRGLIYLKDSDDELIKDLAMVFDSMISDALVQEKLNDSEERNKMMTRLQLIVRKYTGKTPLIIPIITDVNSK